MFFVAAGKPGLGFWLSIAGGVTNMVLDYVLIAVIPLGIAGAAVILSAQTILSASYGGYIYGISSVISYHYGAANYDELRELPENRKNKGITLTEKGRQLCGDVIVPLLRQEEAAMHEMGEKESSELLRLVELYGNAYWRLVKKYCKVSSDIASVSENT